MISGPSFQFVVQNIVPAIVVVGYLAYEIRVGRLETLAAKMDEVIIAVVALAQETERVDEDKVAERLNGHSPDDLRIDHDDHE